MGIENRVKALFRILMLALLALNCRAAIVPIQETVFTTNTFDTDIVGGAIPYFDFPSGKFVASPTAYSNALFYDPALGFLSIVHTNDTGDLLLNLAVAGAAGQSIQAYADKFVVANTNLTFDAVGPYSIRLRINGSNVLEAVAGSISLSGQTNRVADSGSALTFNGVAIGGAVTNSAILQTLYYGGQYGFSASSITPTNIHASNLGVGTNDLFTVPTGKRFLLDLIIASTTNTVSTTNAHTLLGTNGIYYRGSASATITTNNNTSLSFFSGELLFLEAGEILAANISKQGANLLVSGLLFPNTISAYSAKVLSLNSGDNTVYTCPAGKAAVSPTLPTQVPGSPCVTGSYMNSSGSTRVVKCYVVPSGGSPDSTNIQFIKSISNLQTASFQASVMFPGDYIVINTDSNAATQWVKVTVAEIPFP